MISHLPLSLVASISSLRFGEKLPGPQPIRGRACSPHVAGACRVGCRCRSCVNHRELQRRPIKCNISDWSHHSTIKECLHKPSPSSILSVPFKYVPFRVLLAFHCVDFMMPRSHLSRFSSASSFDSTTEAESEHTSSARPTEARECDIGSRRRRLELEH